MATKTISLEIDAYETLREAKRPGESSTDVVRRARFGPADSTGYSILKSLESRRPTEADLRAVEHWRHGVGSARTISRSPWDENRE